MNNNEQPVTALVGKHGERAILKGVVVRGKLNGILASVDVEQRYWNPLPYNIEAVYTFPLPIGAVLLCMEIELAGKKLTAAVVEKTSAEKQYEDAITDGDTAVMVQDTGNGLYTMNVGNLLAGEMVVIRFRFALPLVWQGDRLRFVLPTTIAPRYGNGAEAGLDPWQIPETCTIVEYPFDFSFDFAGQLAQCEICSPSHPIVVATSGEGLSVRLAQGALLDRDVVLTARAKSLVQSLTVVPDHQGHAAFACLRVPPLEGSVDAPLCLKIVIDCSGSMAGVSIAQARKAALAILDLLRPQDYFNVTLFGNAQESIFPALVPGEHGTVELARQRLMELDANMGGTEMEAALEAAYRMSGTAKEGLLEWITGKQSAMQPAVLLITDGEIWGFKKVVARARKSKHRVFTVGVGLAAAEGFIKEIARETGGASEFVAPQEGMTERILTQFHRLRQKEVPKLAVQWDVQPTWQTPMPEAAFSGDTIHVFAGFDDPAPSRVCLAGQDIVEARRIEWHDLARVAAYARIGASEDAATRLKLALDYQLLTPLTNYLVVAERDEKTEQLPKLAKVPQMLAAGWGGTGVAVFRRAKASPQVTSLASADDSQYGIRFCISRSRPVTVEALANSGVDRYDIPSFLRRGDEPFQKMPAHPAPARKKAIGVVPSMTAFPLTPLAFIESLNSMLASLLWVQALPSTPDELKRFGLPDDIVDALTAANTVSGSENWVVATFLYALSESCLAEHIQRGLRRLIVTKWKRTSGDQHILRWCADCLNGMEADAWNWRALAVPVATDVITGE